MRYGAGRRTLIEWILVALAATLLLCWAVSSDLLRRADRATYDMIAKLHDRPVNNDIIIVTIDNDSIRAIGRWPWRRDEHALMLDRLSAAKPKVIIYDVLFTEAGADFAAEQRLIAAVARSKALLPLFMEVPGRNGEPVTVVEPLAGLAAASGGVGHVNLSPDLDGVVRQIFLAEGSSHKPWPHLAALAACRAARRACASPPPERGESGGLVRRSRFLIPFAGPRQHYREVPFAAVLSGQVPPSFFAGKIVLVGATATGVGDAYATPMAERDVLMPGVEVIANVTDALLTGQEIKPASTDIRLIASLIVLWIMLLGFLLLRPRTNIMLGIGLALATLAASFGALIQGDYWLSPIAALVTIAWIYPVWGWRRLQATTSYIHEELQRFRSGADDLPLARRSGDSVGTDIDILRRTIGRVRELRAFIGDTLDGLPDATMLVEIDGRVRLLNAEARAVLGEEAVGQAFGAVLAELVENDDMLSPASVPADPALPTELQDKAGHIFALRWSPVRGADGDLACWILRLADMSELRLAMKQREEALQLLTHDMRSPQASIIAALALGRAADAIDDPLARRVEGYARRTLDLADGFVQLARADAQPLAQNIFNLRDAMDDAIDDLWPLSSSKGIVVESDGCAQEVLVCGDRSLMTRALINLVSNAVKFSPENSRIECRVDGFDDKAICSVRDEGPGLSAEQIAGLFERFQRYDRRVEGAGLGLSLVKTVVKRHGGLISCRSSPGEGARFEIILPLATAAD